MSTITPPQAGIPIGYVTVAGQRLSVEQSPEMTRLFFDLFRRVGGTSATDNTALLAAIDEAQSSAMTFAPTSYDAPLADLLQPAPQEAVVLPDVLQPPQGPSQAAAMSITPGASPYTYTASTPQCVVVRGGTVTTISYVRNGVLTLLGTVAGTFELQAGDGLRIAYSVVPTMNAIPR